jgi:hypothetical protein
MYLYKKYKDISQIYYIMSKYNIEGGIDFFNELYKSLDDCDEEFVSTAGDAPFLDSAEERVHPDTTSGATPAPAAET